MNIKDKQYRNIVLKNSIELMGRLVAVDSSYVTLENVFKISQIPMTDSPNANVLLTAFYTYSDIHKSLKIPVSEILFSGTPEQGLIDEYLKYTSPLIQPQRQKLIIN